MKRLHEYTANFYGTVFGSVVFGIWVMCEDNGIQAMQYFNADSYLIMVLLGLVSGMSIVARTKAFRYEMVSRVSIIGYLSVLISLVLDITLFNASFNYGQVMGIIIIFGSVFASAIVNFGKNKGPNSPRKN